MSMLHTNGKMKYLVGNPAEFSSQPLRPFACLVQIFLSELSKRLMADSNARNMPDVVSFAWWCRKGNVERLARQYDDGSTRLGRGLAFHVAPSNMPVNFAFSWAFSLLAGNANVVRLPSRDFPQIPLIVGHVNELLLDDTYADIRAMNALVTYGRDEAITRALSGIADVRMIWGGDATIQSIRQEPIPPRGLDICFADRYSLCMLSAVHVIELDALALARLALKFFNDAYIMDQNACSSPHMVIWIGDDTEAREAGTRFWPAVMKVIEERYELSPVHSVDKFAQACRDAIELEGFAGLERGDNRLYRMQLNVVSRGIENRRGHNGYFYEWATPQIEDVGALITNKYQTLTYFGLARERLGSFLVDKRLTGIDRIVPVGEAMDIGLIWDGYDLIRTLSRICDVR